MNQLALAPTSLADATPLEHVAAAAAAGFDLVGVRLNRSPGLPFHPVVGNPALVRALERKLDDSGIGVLEIFSFYLEPATRIADFVPALELGAALGGRYAMVIGEDRETPRLTENFGRLCDVAAPLGIIPTIEFVPFRALATLEQALDVLRAVARPNAAICLDPLHFARSGGAPAQLVGLDPALFPYAQLSDGVLGPGEPDLARVRANGLGERRLPGEGALPLAALLGALPRGLPLSVEVPFPVGTGLTAEQWARRVLERTRRFLAAL
ncbi:MAG: sugar phosphate isomerase/epimerase [Alphaproteobacteria bacterium]|nr:sugar phosphate isomerase/epimerase [Alphaproteobacteria bacterium]